LIGIYENSRLIEAFRAEEKASDFIIEILAQISKKYEISRLIYANGPGSYMGIKVAYVILKTFSLVKKCEFCAISGFELNGNSPIKANKALCFVQENGQISLKKSTPKELNLPQNLLNLNIKSDTIPNYIISEI